ncbi:efflux transporter outer membrane subunit [Ottowia sp.]|uniref:efflux transporter outer membrane subunit n=1 Tax=Ottowia sp. TaxID=1898956 RepID=UPI003A86552B
MTPHIKPLPGSRSLISAAAMAALIGLAGCSLTPKYERPEAPVTPTWPANAQVNEPASAVPAADLPWQQFVQDKDLRELIDLGLTSNRDLRVAIANIEQARAAYRIRRADQFPALGLSASGSRSAPNAYEVLGAGSVASQYTVEIGVSAWELDFFGRVAALKDAALASYLATEEARKSTQIALVAAISNAWLQLKTDTALQALAERTLVTREQSLALTKLRFDNGTSSALDMRQAESLTANARATRAQQVRLHAQDINLLTLLVGQPLPERVIPLVPPTPKADMQRNLAQPAPSVAPPAPLPGFAALPAGLPSDLLLRRPDIRAAEQQLISANANIGAARANFFPRITLTAGLGRVSGDLDGLFGSGGQRAWSFGPSLTLPIFDWDRNQSTLDSAQAARDIAVAQYEQAIQTAFREVADALAGRATLGEQLAALQDQVAAEQDRYRLADLRYRNGVANYLDLLDAERSLFAVEQTLAQVRLAQRANEVELYKALGGGWTEPPASKAVAASPNPPTVRQ